MDRASLAVPAVAFALGVLAGRFDLRFAALAYVGACAIVFATRARLVSIVALLAFACGILDASLRIDLALALIEEELCSKLALVVARELVVYLKRSGGQLQYSEPLRFQSHSTGAFGDITTWMRDHLDDHSIEELAAQTHLSVRYFNRKFKAAFGATPGAFIEDLRLDEAR